MTLNVNTLIESLTPIYPKIEDPHFSYEISRRKEFINPQDDVLLPHQEFFKRFLSSNTPYKIAMIKYDMGLGKCVTKETMLLTKGGYVSASDLFDRLQREELYTDHEGGIFYSVPEDAETSVLSFDSGKMKFNPILRVYRQFIKEPICKLYTESGESIRCTMKHRFLTEEKEWVKAFHIKVNDSVHILRNQEMSLARIKSIHFEQLEGYVYDFEIDNSHCYFANGFITHNTCIPAGIVESHKERCLREGKEMKPALIFVPGEELQRNSMYEIAKICTKDKYLPEGEESANENLYRKRIFQNVSRYYKYVKAETELAKISRLFKNNEAYIRSEYGNRIIIVDEFHKYRDSNDDSLYHILARLINIVYDSAVSIILMSGTPIWDSAIEFPAKMNLLLPKQNKIPTGLRFISEYFDKSTDEFRPEKKKELLELLKGKIFYLRFSDSDTKKIYMGHADPWLRYIKVHPDHLSPFQSEAAKKASEELHMIVRQKGNTEVISYTEGGPFYRNGIQSCLFVWPDGTYGQVGFDKHCKTSKKSYRMDEMTEEAIYPLSNLQKYSTKYASVTRIIENESLGEKVFIFFNNNVSGGGALLYSMILERYGYARLRGHPDTKIKRHAIITSDKTTASDPITIEKTLKYINHESNKNGQYVKVLLGSKKITEGFTLLDFRQFHCVCEIYNHSTYVQALGRVVRFMSHAHFSKPEDRYVKIFLHVAAYEGKNYEIPTTDMFIYSLYEKKLIKTSSINRLFKEVAVDCGLYKSKNQKDTDDDFSIECDLQRCKYSCFDWPDGFDNTAVEEIPANMMIDESYNLWFADDEILQVTEKIRDLFSIHFHIRLAEIKRLLNKHSNFIILCALDNIITTKMTIRNRYGFFCFLQEENNNYFLSDNILTKERFIENQYISQPFITERISLFESVRNSIISNDEAKISNFNSLTNKYVSLSDEIYSMVRNSSDEEKKQPEYSEKMLRLRTEAEMVHKKISETIESFSFIVKIHVIEMMIKRLINGSEQTDDSAVVLSYVFEPILKVYRACFFRMDSGNIVHILYNTLIYPSNSYNITSIYLQTGGEMRVYDISIKEWRNVENETEEFFIITEIKEKISQSATEENEEDKLYITNINNIYGCYATMSEIDGKFRIHTLKGLKGQSRGFVCEYKTIEELVDLFFDLDFLPDPNPLYNNISNEELIETIKEKNKFSNHKNNLEQKSTLYLQRLLTLFNMSVSELCMQLKFFFINRNIMYSL